MTTIKDVAAVAGVSASTVSRVLSGKSYVNEQTRQRVLEAVKKMDYSPNVLAKGLKMGRSNTIALLVPSIQNLIFPDITRGAEDTARKNGFTVVLCNTDEDVDVEKSYINQLKKRWIDGFIVCSMLPGSDHIRSLREEGFPLVLINRCEREDHLDAVIVDHVQASYDAVHYLVRTGHRRIALALGREELTPYREWLDGYLAALRDNYLPVEERLILRETNGDHSLYDLTRNMFSVQPWPDSIFATSDSKAIVVLHALHDMRVRMQQDISVLGFDTRIKPVPCRRRSSIY
ncbi:LacI family DNA-binding transcriptional regulator [Faecalispora anaeroviscerum]|uniref:LacI family DNA-binding transcriptional regulator n=1 Tax=Faecalispora anaeroviscerum TaxID=2991836 RepID=UPI0024B9AC37|nr:LacI family DNA-binding transcriptional regulator [Faecalispora anaeroviscerum]